MTKHTATAIVGAGFCGLGLAIRLKAAGLGDFLIFERARAVGGTWRDNTYPGCACDVESHLYSFSFAPNPTWSRLYAPQAEIQDYLRGCVERFDLGRRILFGHTVTGARWDEGAKLWRIQAQTEAGPCEYTADALALAPGPLNEPKIPAIPGLPAFTGKVFHSARWDHEHPLSGRAVAVIGTGASAIQLIPQIQPLVKSLAVVQRTPAWVLPRRDQPVPAWQRRAHALLPATQLWRRLETFLRRELGGIVLRTPRLAWLTRHVAQKHLAAAIPSPQLRALLTPRYAVGCKRVLIADDYYPALAQANVEVLAAGLASVTPGGIVLTDGRERAVDTIIFATGFQVFDSPYAAAIVGAGGISLAEAWQGSPKAHLGTTVAGFPNLFLLLGPNTGLGHTSVLLMAEAQIEHIVGALRYMRAAGLAAIAPKPERQAAFAAACDRGHRGAIWQAGGCVSWYQDRNGRYSALWPRSVPAFMRRVRRFRPRDYVLTAAARPTAAVPASKHGPRAAP